MSKKTTLVSGEYKELFSSGKVKTISLDLHDICGVPILKFLDCTNKNKSKELFSLHITEAIELKAMIDKAILNFHWDMHEYNLFKPIVDKRYME